jgi:hypothetical protein
VSQEFHPHPVQFRPPINDRQEIAYDRQKSRVSNLHEKRRESDDYHDQELWERYFKPCKNTNLQLAFLTPPEQTNYLQSKFTITHP